MSAWAQLVNADGSDEWLELCNEALKEVQHETARKLAEKIRSDADRRYGDNEISFAALMAAHDTADLIDPEVK